MRRKTLTKGLPEPFSVRVKLRWFVKVLRHICETFGRCRRYGLPHTYQPRRQPHHHQPMALAILMLCQASQTRSN